MPTLDVAPWGVAENAEFLSSVALGRKASAVTSFHAREGRRPFNGGLSRGYLFFRASRGTITLINSWGGKFNDILKKLSRITWDESPKF